MKNRCAQIGSRGGKCRRNAEEQWWAEVRENRELGFDLDEWPKRCPITGGEIDEDGSHACPDDCPHQKSAEFQTKMLACEICGDERRLVDLNNELVCPPCEEREGR